MWGLILCVNLTGLRDAQIAGKPKFLGVSERVFLGEVIIWICRLYEDRPHHCRWALPNPLGSWIETKDRETVNLLTLVELGHPSSFAHRHQAWLSDLWARTGNSTIGSSGFISLQTLNELHHWFPGSPTCRWQTVGLLGLHNPILIVNFLLYIYIHL